MNTASQDLPRHLSVLRERMLHPTDYETAVHYFLEEFGGDEKFVEMSEADDPPHLITVLKHVVGKALGGPVTFDASRAMLLREHKFHHGNAIVQGRVVLFFFLAAADTGIAAVIPGVAGAMEVARFKLGQGLADPRLN